MHRAIIAATLSVLATGTTLASAGEQANRSVTDPKLGTRIIITGCLHQGTSRDSFMLLGVTERPADGPAPAIPVPFAIYWLDSTDGLKAVVGELVDITGKVTERRSQKGVITVAVDPSETLSTDVNVTSGVRDVTTEKFDDRPRPQGTSGKKTEIEVSRPVYKLVVEDVRALTLPVGGPACK